MDIHRPRRFAVRALAHPTALADTLRIDLSKASLGVPLRVGAASGSVLVVGGLLGEFSLAGFAALGALVSAFCRADPYRVRFGRLLVLGVGLIVSLVCGAVLGALSANTWTEIAVLSVLGGIAALLIGALHITGPGAVVFVFGATGSAGFAGDFGDVGRVAVATGIGVVCGVVASLSPWVVDGVRRGVGGGRSWGSSRRTLRDARSFVASPSGIKEVGAEGAVSGGEEVGAEGDGPVYESVWACLSRRPHSDHVHTAARSVVAAGISGAVAVGVGLSHPLWASMGAVAAMQGVRYHRTVQRGIARLVGNVVGGVIAAVLLALPLGHWGAIAAIIVLQIIAEICAPWNYAITSTVVTPMALLMTALSVGLDPSIAVDRVLDTMLGVVIGIVIALLTVTRPDIDGILESTGVRHPRAGSGS
ncbi:FUSC family protein [Gordonia sp. (in: high G+C Gram-positive bacteria)]|uniref:FUSC family protein n=1 Tax=Gordonia sp. (in: high G+C Gram-positive bacteria) TaxID=84139 RepID=UPI002BAC04D8|nr:FUSC family protein [Gordonia sp. (in: high G+C Gram-positive bacteria)]HMS75546.1 FUSC family protein [Gordonia sp. (in: high G+C Gram-positive bacteria)]